MINYESFNILMFYVHLKVGYRCLCSHQYTATQHPTTSRPWRPRRCHFWSNSAAPVAAITITSVYIQYSRPCHCFSSAPPPRAAVIGDQYATAGWTMAGQFQLPYHMPRRRPETSATAQTFGSPASVQPSLLLLNSQCHYLVGVDRDRWII